MTSFQREFSWSKVESGASESAMEKIDQVPQDEDLVDFTQPVENYSEDNLQKIRISNGINLKDLRDEGIVFDPVIPDRERWRREEEKEYFTQHTAELQRVLAERGEVQHGKDGEGTDEEGGEGGSSEFDELRKKMQAVTKDGGVWKKVIREGFQTGGAPKFSPFQMRGKPICARCCARGSNRDFALQSELGR